jgi:hypothetical protein
MAEITYLPEVECEVVKEAGLFGTSVVSVADEDGNKQFLRVARGDVARQGGKAYLGVGVVRLDYAGGRALVELPAEADSGSRRVWVPFTRFRSKQEAAG